MQTNHKAEKDKNGLNRALSSRHVQIIAIAGTIGTGLFLGSGRSIALTGPSIILVYLITGFFMYLMMRAMGEMLYQSPNEHTFISFITRYLGKGWGHFASWSYWISVIFIGMAEITAIGEYVQFWLPDVPKWIIQLIFLVLLTSVNLIAVKLFGEVEFWFGMIKIVAILSLIATGVIMVLTNFQTPVGYASIGNIIDNFHLFPNGWWKFFLGFQMVFFSYQAIEFVGLTTSETKNPRQVIPKAINEIPTRIIIFYVGALLAIMAIYPWTYLTADESPFVKVFELAGIKWAAALINFVVLTSASSALNSTLYSTGRQLYQMAQEPANGFLRKLKVDKLSSQQVPKHAIIVSAVCVALAALISVIPGISDSFSLITASSSGVYIAIYALLMWSHWRYRHSDDFMADGFLMPGYKWLNPLTNVFFAIVYVSLFFQESTIVGAIGATIWIIAMGLYSNLVFGKQK